MQVQSSIILDYKVYNALVESSQFWSVYVLNYKILDLGVECSKYDTHCYLIVGMWLKERFCYRSSKFS
jgi:hypothetical protein